MNKQQRRKKLWSTFFLLGEELIQAITQYLTIDPASRYYGRIFKLNLLRYQEEEAERIIGIKLFEDKNIYVLIHCPDTLISRWESLQPDQLEFSHSVSRIDLLMWYCDEIESHLDQEAYWIEDTGTIYKATFKKEAHEP